MASGRFSVEFLHECTLYASTEPCATCAGAIYWGNVGRVIFALGAEDVCSPLGVKHRVTKPHPHRFRHTAGTIVQEELGDPRLTAEFLAHHGLGSVAGYTEVSQRRREGAADALWSRGL